MATSSQNIIHSSSFNFEYESKASAVRCNILIESIFNSLILPELEAAISNNIPEGVLIELAKLEINIGRIDEKEISGNLAGRISTSLVDALQGRIEIRNNLIYGNTSYGGKKSEKYLIERIEIFLQKGYFPFGMDESLSVDDLVTEAIRQNQKELIEMIRKYARYDSSVRRIAYGFRSETFDLIVFTIVPVNGQWIVDFRKILTSTRLERNLNRISSDEFLRTINYFILKYLLNETTSVFSKKKFSDSIWKEFMFVFNAELSEHIHQELEIDRLIEILNSGSNEFKSLKRQFLKVEIIRAITDNVKREILIERLNRNGVSLMLELFNQDKVNSQLNLITSFISKVTNINSPEMESANLKRMLSLIDDERQYPEISGIRKALSKSQNQPPAEGSRSDSAFAEEYYALNRREIIGSYLDSGHLPAAFSDLNLRDVQSLLRDLVQQKDELLAAQLRGIEDAEVLINRLHVLMDNKLSDNLEEYLIHFFRDEYAILSQIISEIKQQFTFSTNSPIHSQVFRNEVFMIALAASKGGSISDVYLYSILERLNNQLSKEFSNSDKLVHFLSSKSRGSLKSGDFPNRVSSNAELKRMIGRDYQLLVRKLHQTGFGIQSSGEEIQGLIKKLAFYFQVVKTVFLDFLQENRSELLQVYALLKFHLPTNQWNPLEKSLLSRNILRSEIERFKPHLDDILGIIAKPELNLSTTYEDLSSGEPEKLKTFLILILSDKALYEKFISGTKVSQIVQINTTSSKELKEMIEFWQVSKNSEHGKKSADESDNLYSAREINQYLSFLRFYSHNGFFPWWAGNLSFPELFAGLKQSSQLYPNTFEELFLQLEREEPVFEHLILKIPPSVIHEFDQLISGHTSLNAVWKKILQVNKKKAKSSSGSVKVQVLSSIQDSGIDTNQFVKNDSREPDLLFKELYFKDYEEILTLWTQVDSQIESQIKEYILLSPYFYFRNINPAQWRQTVYQFSRNYYKPEGKKVNNQFHAVFLKHLKKKYPGIHWAHTFTTVYRLVQSSNANHPVVFPPALVQLLNIEPGSHKKSEETGKKESDMLFTEDEGIEVKISNAGLILFWPFLTRLFERLSLVKDGAFINRESMNRAVYIIQYLVYNEIDFPEYKLVLNKLLVGMPTQEHLVPFITISVEEKELAHSLFNGLINNWEKVKNSSQEGIQETFIQREGILRFGKDKVSLVVEKKGVDILLNSIPWNISLIKLSWMKKPIYVDWI